MKFMSAREAADKWGISQRRVAVLCSENRIDNAAMVGVQAFYEFKDGNLGDSSLNAAATLPIDYR